MLKDELHNRILELHEAGNDVATIAQNVNESDEDVQEVLNLYIFNNDMNRDRQEQSVNHSSEVRGFTFDE